MTNVAHSTDCAISVDLSMKGWDSGHITLQLACAHAYRMACFKASPFVVFVSVFLGFLGGGAEGAQ